MSLYKSYKEIKEERVTKKLGDYEIDVINGVKGILENFQRVDKKSTKIVKPLISKNGKSHLSKIKEDKKEKMKNYPKKYEPSDGKENNIDIDENSKYIYLII